MRIGRSPSPDSNRTRVVVLTADAEFDRSARATFGASSAIELTIVAGRIAELGDTLDVANATVVVIDLDAGSGEEMAALTRLMARVRAWPPVVAVTQSFDENVARTLLQMRVADFLVKPVAAIDLVRACARVSQTHTGGADAPTEAQIYTFLPAVGGAGVTRTTARRPSGRRPAKIWAILPPMECPTRTKSFTFNAAITPSTSSAWAKRL